MAQVSGTYSKYDAKGQRESLADTISNISPTDTPFLSGAGMGRAAKSTLEEWQTDTLASADGSNASIEGDDTSFSAPAATVRVGNYSQISDKSLILTGTLEAVDKAGRRSELAYQMAKRAAELKRDQETIFLRAQAGVGGSDTVARTLAGMNAWLKTNVDSGTNGVDPTYVSGVPAAVRTDGTQRAISETILKAVIQSSWDNGGKPDVVMVGPFNKQAISQFSGVATRNFDMSNVAPKPTAIIASAGIYVSDFGTFRVIPNRFQRERDGWVLDFSLVEVRNLRPHQVDKLAKTGDAEKRLMLVEYTLVVQQEAGLGLMADLNAS